MIAAGRAALRKSIYIGDVLDCVENSYVDAAVSACFSSMQEAFLRDPSR